MFMNADLDNKKVVTTNTQPTYVNTTQKEVGYQTQVKETQPMVQTTFQKKDVEVRRGSHVPIETETR